VSTNHLICSHKNSNSASGNSHHFTIQNHLLISQMK
jgi:hypothetical protein